MRRKFTKYPKFIRASYQEAVLDFDEYDNPYEDYSFIVKRYEDDLYEDGRREVIRAKSLREAEDILNNDEYVDWWDYDDDNNNEEEYW